MDGFAGPGERSGGMPPDAADMFAQFFGGGATFFDAGGPGSHRRKGEDTEIPYQVTLEDLYNGKSVKMNMEKEIICGTCNGLAYLVCTRSLLFMPCFQIGSQRECQTQRVYTMRG
jgi:DnaJ family protein A protein 2